jgi:hypothetical protein
LDQPMRRGIQRQLSPIGDMTRLFDHFVDARESMPSALAVLKLITNSNLVGCSTGKSRLGTLRISLSPTPHQDASGRASRMRTESGHLIASGCDLCGQDTQRCQAIRFARATAHQIRAGDQCYHREGARPDGPADYAHGRRRGDRVAVSGMSARSLSREKTQASAARVESKVMG